MKSKVYFVKSRVTKYESPGQRFGKLLSATGLAQFQQHDTVALKVHFGEEGATGYIHPSFVRVLSSALKTNKARPFLTDTNTLYHGFRSNGVDHLELAIRNGFCHSVTGVPLVIADGIRSKSVKEIDVNLKHFTSVKIGSAIWEADGLITLNHFKGHLLTGFGGAIKNLSMGCGSRATKQRMHADMRPELRAGVCIACGECVSVCPTGAISLHQEAEFDYELCVGCAECLTACPERAIQIQWGGTSRSVQEKMAEVAFAVNGLFKQKILHVNFLLNITPECDCLKWTDNPIVQDIGILASVDPVAADQASLDLVTASHTLPNSVISDHAGPGVEKFQLVHPDADPTIQLEYGESIGLGNRKYELVEID